MILFFFKHFEREVLLQRGHHVLVVALEAFVVQIVPFFLGVFKQLLYILLALGLLPLALEHFAATQLLRGLLK